MPPQFQWNPEPLFSRVNDEIGRRQRLAGQRMVEHARVLAPERTGYLKTTIYYEYDEANHELILGAKAPYAIFVEFGTINMMAHPYLRPALSEAAAVWGGSVPTVALEFKNAPKLKSDIAKPVTARHHQNQAYNRKVGIHYNSGNLRHMKQYIRTRRGGEGS